MDNNNSELVAVWADDSWCFMSEISEMSWKSDDYYVTWYNKEVHV